MEKWYLVAELYPLFVISMQLPTWSLTLIFSVGMTTTVWNSPATQPAIKLQNSPAFPGPVSPSSVVVSRTIKPEAQKICAASAHFINTSIIADGINSQPNQTVSSGKTLALASYIKNQRRQQHGAISGFERHFRQYHACTTISDQRQVGAEGHRVRCDNLLQTNYKSRVWIMMSNRRRQSKTIPPP